jgi:hypothetical protein
MKSIKTFEAFLQEADEKKPEGAERLLSLKVLALIPTRKR